MYRIVLFLFLLVSFAAKSQVIGKTTMADLYSEIRMATDIEKTDLLTKEGGDIVKILYKNGHRREFCFYNRYLFCKKVWDPNETAREKFQKMKDEQIIIKDGNLWVIRGGEFIVVDVGTDDFGREWLVYLGAPKLN